jgi:hypothetical protein
LLGDSHGDTLDIALEFGPNMFLKNFLLGLFQSRKEMKDIILIKVKRQEKISAGDELWLDKVTRLLLGRFGSVQASAEP